jgi:hypothetical protein
MLMKPPSLSARAAQPSRARHLFTPLAVRALGAASMLLGRLAAELSAAAAPRFKRDLPPVLEFYADAGAPEGALYLNGELVGYLPGITRL